MGFLFRGSDIRRPAMPAQPQSNATNLSTKQRSPKIARYRLLTKPRLVWVNPNPRKLPGE
jgi:hypothetical protein